MYENIRVSPTPVCIHVYGMTPYEVVSYRIFARDTYIFLIGVNASC